MQVTLYCNYSPPNSQPHVQYPQLLIGQLYLVLSKLKNQRF